MVTSGSRSWLLTVEQQNSGRPKNTIEFKYNGQWSYYGKYCAQLRHVKFMKPNKNFKHVGISLLQTTTLF